MVRRTSAIHGRLIANNNNGCLQKMLTPIVKLKQNDGEDPAKIQHHTLTSFTPKHKYSKFFFDHP